MSVQMMPNLVSTVIPVYNRPDLVLEAVDSVLAQTYRPIEVILVDDGSTDETPRVLENLAGAHPDAIRVIHKENGGPGLAREAGRVAAHGEFIQYLDSDDFLMPTKFDVQVRALRDRPECDIAYGVTRVVDSKGEVIREPSKWTGRHFDFLFPALIVDHWWHPHTPLYRRSLCDRIGPWPKNQPEDWDYDARAGALKAKLAHCNETVSCHRQHEGHRVTKWAFEQYLPQEAWFLPRLHACAMEAGVPGDCPEMRHLSRWAFRLAREIGIRGDRLTANRLLTLAFDSVGEPGFSLRAFSLASGIIGWRLAGRLSRIRDLVARGHVGRDTLPPSYT